jgi:hypothetical protein
MLLYINVNGTPFVFTTVKFVRVEKGKLRCLHRCHRLKHRENFEMLYNTKTYSDYIRDKIYFIHRYMLISRQKVEFAILDHFDLPNLLHELA